ncbi:MAG TPA: sulfotransferase, partial [Polyangiaceae bacterium]|nr:sulfotransferase [Polyangiaceae bacterium]
SQPEWLSRYAVLGEREPCTCGTAIVSCLFWNDVARAFAALSGEPFDPSFENAYVQTIGTTPMTPLLNVAVQSLLMVANRSWLELAGMVIPPVSWNAHAARRNGLLFRAIRQVSRKRVVVDASKDPLRLKTLYVSDPESVRVVWLIRDGRAITWSTVRRLGLSVERAAFAWLRVNVRTHLLLRTIPADRRILVKYEDLCSHPQRELDRIVHLLGEESCTFSPMLAKDNAHFVGGNLMRHRVAEQALELDDAWRRGLSARDVRRFDRIAGWLNRRFGYG